MAQKINPLSFRIGTIKIWNSFIQVYGKSFKTYFVIWHKFYKIQSILYRIFHKNNFILDYQEWKIYRDKIFLNIYYINFPSGQKSSKIKFFSKILLLITQLFRLKIYTYFYFKPEFKSDINLIVSYTQYLLNQNNMPKKILLTLCKLLENQLNTKKISFFKSGILKVNLKGFKIRLSGRLDGSKNQMAKSIEQSVGSLPLTCIKSYVEYTNKELYTKYGICGLQVWLFYELI